MGKSLEMTGERFLPEMIDVQIQVEHYHRYQIIQDIVSNKLVLDIASGEGYGSFHLSKFAKNVVGVDISAEAVKHASSKYKNSNLSYLQGTATKIPLEDHSVDVVVSFETIEHMEHQDQIIFMAEIKRVLKKDGLLIVSTPDKHIYSDLENYENEYHLHEFYQDEFKEFIGTYFKNINVFEQLSEAASFIAKENTGFHNLKEVKFLGGNLPMGKYLIAICSDFDIPDFDLNSVFIPDQYGLSKVVAKMCEAYQLKHSLFKKNEEIEQLKLAVKELENQVAMLQEEK